MENYSHFTDIVLKQVAKIPKGTVVSYKYIAHKIGKPESARAVANACGKNKNLVTVPCHRVIKSDGSIGGYSGPGGVAQKIKLLKQEGIDVNNLKDYLL